MPVRFVKTTIAEPFPVFYSHTNQRCRKANDPATEGPFYAAGSEWYDLEDVNTFLVKQKAADFFRQDGYTVTVERVLR